MQTLGINGYCQQHFDNPLFKDWQWTEAAFTVAALHQQECAMFYHYVGKLADANVFLPYVACAPALAVEPHQAAYPKARVWAAFAFSPGVVGILVGVYLGIATADVGNLLSSVAMFVLFGQLLFGLPAAMTGAVVVYLRWHKTLKQVLAAALLGGGVTWMAAFIVAKDVEVVSWYALIGLVVALLVAVLVLPKPR